MALLDALSYRTSVSLEKHATACCGRMDPGTPPATNSTPSRGGAGTTARGRGENGVGEEILREESVVSTSRVGSGGSCS